MTPIAETPPPIPLLPITLETVGTLPVGTVVYWTIAGRRYTATRMGPDGWYAPSEHGQRAVALTDAEVICGVSAYVLTLGTPS